MNTKEEFVVKYKDEFKALSKLIWDEMNLKNIDLKTITDIETEVKARRYACAIVERWIAETFSQAYTVEGEYNEEQDSVFGYYDSELRKENRGNK